MQRRILVTGANGFVGHHLVEYLLEITDFDIVALIRLDYAGDLDKLIDTLSNIQHPL